MDANLSRTICFIACAALVGSNAIVLTIAHRCDGLIKSAQIRCFDLHYMTGSGINKSAHIIKIIAPLICNQFNSYITTIQFICQLRHIFYLGGTAAGIKRSFNL